MGALLRLHELGDASLADVLDFTLEEILLLTGSAVGYIFFYEEDTRSFTLHAWSKTAMRQCAVVDKPQVYKLDETGLWGEVVRKRRPVVVNDFAAPHPLKRGYPPGHVELRNFLSLPVFRGRAVKAVVGVGNKDGVYTDADLSRLDVFVKSAWNVVQRKQVEESLRVSEERFRNLVEAMRDCIWECDDEFRFRYLSPRVPHHLGYEPDEILGRGLWDFMPQGEFEAFLAENAQTLRQRQPAVGQEYTFIRKDGMCIPAEITVTPFFDAKGRLQGYRGVLRDITQRKRLEAELITLATTDSLTGITNRRHFLEMAQAELMRSRRYGIPMALIMLDIDHFKHINDTCGHQAGDEALRRMAQTCRANLRASDIFGRIGGEEFAAVLVQADIQAARHSAERLLKALADLTVATSSGPVRFTVSIGLALFDPAGDTLEDLMKRADEALYAAKRAGRNRVSVG